MSTRSAFGIELIVNELGDEGVVIGGTGSNDTRHAIH